MALPLSRISVPSSASLTDRNILAPAINRVIDELNALGARVDVILAPPAPVPAPPVAVIDISAALEAAIMAVPIGSRFVLRGLAREFVCQVDG
jgi:hypothetical protein